ncbi:type IV secretion system DNA-binding domain-containing protein [Sulfurospirillum sp. 'SP']|nr:type IV secretion system DNA-binding domain-containing protein [Sulfurospirillum sp. 'SP']WNY99950.1 type IV secretion system DNA-binding domain-containing protein [Sulfurospirillum sp. 'SP']
MSTGVIVILSILGFMMAFILYPRRTENHGFIYENYPLSRFAWGSGANPKKLIKGYIWTPYFKLKTLFNKPSNTVFLDEFRFLQEFANESMMNSFFRKRAESVKISLSALQLTQAVLVVGKMGSGKTMFYNNLFVQLFYARMLLHEMKQDTIQTLYIPRKDIILCPYDERSHLWDVMSEDEGIIQTFFLEYMNAVIGEKTDYFKSAAQKRFNDVALQVKTSYKNATSAQKWLLFIKLLRDMFDEIESSAQKSQKDVQATMEQILEPLEIMAYQMQDPNQKSFTIKEFFKRKNQSKLILSNIAEYDKALKPLFGAFIACFTQIHVSMPDTTTDFTLYALDEYLNFVQNMDESTRKRIHTLIRSKGGILVGGVQYLPINDKKLLEELTSSAFAWLYFSTIQPETADFFINSVKDTEYSYEERNESYTDGKKSVSWQTKKESTHLLNSHILNGLGEDYSHITFIPQKQVLYKGYTPVVELTKRHEGFIKKDLSGFYELKYKSHKKIDPNTLKVEDMFARSMSKLERFKLFKRYESSQNKETFAKENNMQDVNFELFFKEFIPDEMIIQSKMKLLSLQERFDLAGKWNSIPKENSEAQLAFIEQNQLYGALPDIFNFTTTQLQKINF